MPVPSTAASRLETTSVTLIAVLARCSVPISLFISVVSVSARLSTSDRILRARGVAWVSIMYSALLASSRSRDARIRAGSGAYSLWARSNSSQARACEGDIAAA